MCFYIIYSIINSPKKRRGNMLIEQYKEEKIIPFLQAVKNYEYSGSVVRLKAFDTLIITDGTLKSAMRIESDIEEEYDEDTQRQTLRRLMIKAAAAMPEDEAAAAAYRRRIARRFIAKGFPQGMVFDELKDILL